MTCTEDMQIEKVVVFDVGGRIFKVRRSLLDSYPDTMLARSASVLWNPTTNSQQDDNAGGKGSSQKPIFIDRDGLRFSYILDYMRDGGVVTLPLTVSRESFVKELEYFSFDISSINSNNITCAIPTCDAVTHIEALHTKFDTWLTQSEMRKTYQIFAYALFSEFVWSGALVIRINYGQTLSKLPSTVARANRRAIPLPDINISNAASSVANEYRNQEEASTNNSTDDSDNSTDDSDNSTILLNKYLAEYGLRCQSIEAVNPYYMSVRLEAIDQCFSSTKVTENQSNT
jgi:BTB/POZ domain